MSAGRTVPPPAHACPRSATPVVMFPDDVWRCGICRRAWTWRQGSPWPADGIWVPVIPTEPGVPSARVSRGSQAYWGAIGEPAPSAEHYRRGPSELAHRIRDLLRAEHKRCRNPGCALTFIWAEDVQEILDARDRLVAVWCTCRPRESGEAPDVPERDCPVHGEPVAPRVCTCVPHPYGDGPEVDCPVHGEQAR